MKSSNPPPQRQEHHYIEMSKIKGSELLLAVCVDNSDWMINGDYSPSRWTAQHIAVIQHVNFLNSQSIPYTLYVILMAGTNGTGRPSILSILSNNKYSSTFNLKSIKMAGESDIIGSLQLVHLLFKNKDYPRYIKKLICFSGSPFKGDDHVSLTEQALLLRDNHISLELITFGDCSYNILEKHLYSHSYLSLDNNICYIHRILGGHLLVPNLSSVQWIEIYRLYHSEIKKERESEELEADNDLEDDEDSRIDNSIILKRLSRTLKSSSMTSEGKLVNDKRKNINNNSNSNNNAPQAPLLSSSGGSCRKVVVDLSRFSMPKSKYHLVVNFSLNRPMVNQKNEVEIDADDIKNNVDGNAQQQIERNKQSKLENNNNSDKSVSTTPPPPSRFLQKSDNTINNVDSNSIENSNTINNNDKINNEMPMSKDHHNTLENVSPTESKIIGESPESPKLSTSSTTTTTTTTTTSTTTSSTTTTTTQPSKSVWTKAVIPHKSSSESSSSSSSSSGYKPTLLGDMMFLYKNSRILLEFPAGKCTYQKNIVTPQSAKGQLSLIKIGITNYQIIWRNALTMKAENIILFNYREAKYIKVNETFTKDRVFYFKFQNGPNSNSHIKKPNFFIWPQYEDESKDELYLKKINHIINTQRSEHTQNKIASLVKIVANNLSSSPNTLPLFNQMQNPNYTPPDEMSRVLALRPPQIFDQPNSPTHSSSNSSKNNNYSKNIDHNSPLLPLPSTKLSTTNKLTTPAKLSVFSQKLTPSSLNKSPTKQQIKEHLNMFQKQFDRVVQNGKLDQLSRAYADSSKLSSKSTSTSTSRDNSDDDDIDEDIDEDDDEDERSGGRSSLLKDSSDDIRDSSALISLSQSDGSESDPSASMLIDVQTALAKQSGSSLITKLSLFKPNPLTSIPIPDPILPTMSAKPNSVGATVVTATGSLDHHAPQLNSVVTASSTTTASQPIEDIQTAYTHEATAATSTSNSTTTSSSGIIKKDHLDNPDISNR